MSNHSRPPPGPTTSSTPSGTRPAARSSPGSAPAPRPVGKLADQLTIGRPAVSKHLRVLEGAGLVRHESRGTRNLYALAPEGMAVAQQWLVGMWDTALAAYADAVDAALEEQFTRQAKSLARSQRPSRRKRTGPGGSA